MIIETVLDVILTVASRLFAFINLPSFPTSITNVLNTVFNYLSDGIGLLLYFVDLNVFRACLTIFIALIGLKYSYRFVLFVVGVIGKIKGTVEL